MTQPIYVKTKKPKTIMVCVHLALYLTLVIVDAVGISVRTNNR